MNYLAVAVLGEDRPDAIDAITRSILECKCDILDSRVTLLGEQRGMLLLVQGNWNTLARLETQLQKLERQHGLSIIHRRTEGFREQPELRPYAVEINALEQTGVVAQATGFFTGRGVWIEDLATRSYRVPRTGTPMCTLNLILGIPGSLHIGGLREEFLDFCDEHNWDAVLEPVKS